MKPSLSERRLPPGRWSTGVREALQGSLEATSPGDVAVFDFDETLFNGDCGDGLLAALIGNLDLALDAAALEARVGEAVDAGPDGAAKVKLQGALRGMVDAALELERRGHRPGAPSRTLIGSELHRAYALGIWRLYRMMETAQGYGPMVAYPLHGSLHGGRSAQDLSDKALRLLDGYASPDWLWDRHPLEPIPEIAALVTGLIERHAEVWVVTGSTHPVVSALAASGRLGFTLPPERIIGVRLAESGGILQPRLHPDWPMTWGPGKVAAINRIIGRAPVLVAGDSAGDLNMLTHWDETRWRLLVPPGEPGALAALCHRAAAGEAGYLWQRRDEVTGRWRG